MRRKEREITERKQIIEILEACKVCRIAMQDEDGLYLVPLNFGYTFEEDELILYFHSAKEGRKVNIFKQNPKVCFEMDCNHNLIEASQPCACGYEYASIIGNGTAEIIETAEEKAKALSILMRHQTGKEVTFEEKMTAAVHVMKVTADSFAAKACKKG